MTFGFGVVDGPPEDPLKDDYVIFLTLDSDLELTIADYEQAAGISTHDGKTGTTTRGLTGDVNLKKLAFGRKWQMRAWTADRESADALVQSRGSGNTLTYEKPDAGFWIYFKQT